MEPEFSIKNKYLILMLVNNFKHELTIKTGITPKKIKLAFTQC